MTRSAHLFNTHRTCSLFPRVIMLGRVASPSYDCTIYIAACALMGIVYAGMYQQQITERNITSLLNPETHGSQAAIVPIIAHIERITDHATHTFRGWRSELPETTLLAFFGRTTANTGGVHLGVKGVLSCDHDAPLVSIVSAARLSAAPRSL